MPEILLPETEADLALWLAEHANQKRCLAVKSEVEVKDAGRMAMRGYASTGTADLSDESVPPSAFEKYEYRYRNNPVYCFQHDWYMPIGKVNDFHRDDKGLYFDEIVLTPTPVVKDFIWPLVEDGVLRQQSIGFYSMKQSMTGGVLVHDLVYLVECSLVTIACNPEAEAEMIRSIHGSKFIKGFASDNPVTMRDILWAYKHGTLISPSEISKSFSMSVKTPNEVREERDLPMTEATSEKKNGQEVPVMAPDFSSVKAIEKTAEDWNLYTPDVPDQAVSKIHKDYPKLMRLVHAGMKQVGDDTAYLWPIGTTTSEGFNLVFEKMAATFCRVMGAKGAAIIDPEEKLKVVETLCQCYEKLDPEYKAPTYQDVPLNMLAPTVFAEVKFADVQWHNGEKDIFLCTVAEAEVENWKSLILSYDSADAVPDRLKQIFKGFYMSVDIWGYVWDREDADTLAQIIDLIMPPEETPLVSVLDSAEADEVETKSEETPSSLVETLKQFKADRTVE